MGEIVASTATMGILLQQGIGDTIRVSLTPEPGAATARKGHRRAGDVANNGPAYFHATGHRLPGCGRTTSTFFQELAAKTQSYLRAQMPAVAQPLSGVENMSVAVMGCVVNGPDQSSPISASACRARHPWLPSMKTARSHSRETRIAGISRPCWMPTCTGLIPGRPGATLTVRRCSWASGDTHRVSRALAEGFEVTPTQLGRNPRRPGSDHSASPRKVVRPQPAAAMSVFVVTRWSHRCAQRPRSPSAAMMSQLQPSSHCARSSPDCPENSAQVTGTNSGKQNRKLIAPEACNHVVTAASRAQDRCKSFQHGVSDAATNSVVHQQTDRIENASANAAPARLSPLTASVIAANCRSKARRLAASQRILGCES